MPNQDEHLRQLNAELDELRRSLAKLRAQLDSPSSKSPRDFFEAIQENINALKTLARALQADAARAQSNLEKMSREAFDQKVRRADATAKLKGRERLLEEIQHSAAC